MTRSALNRRESSASLGEAEGLAVRCFETPEHLVEAELFAKFHSLRQNFVQFALPSSVLSVLSLTQCLLQSQWLVCTSFHATLLPTVLQ